MAGRRPIFATLAVGIFSFLRDGLYKALLEPLPPSKRRAQRMQKQNKAKEENIK